MRVWCEGGGGVTVAISLTGFFTGAQEKLAKTFKTAADSLRESFRFAHSTSEEVLQEFGYQK